MYYDTSVIKRSHVRNISHSKPYLTKIDRTSVNTVLLKGMITEGEMVHEFEEKVKKFLGLSEGVATSSGTDALFLALKSLDIKNGDEVIIPTYVCCAVWNAVRATGALPVLCDIGEDWCVNAELIKSHITKNTKAIIVVHIFGIVADIAPILELGIPIIEDCCQALGASREKRMAGTYGDLCVLSFHATKLLTTGEGGMLLTKNSQILNKLKNLKVCEVYNRPLYFRNPMSDMQAALGLSQLSQYLDFVGKRKIIANNYLQNLPKELIKDMEKNKKKSIFFRFLLRSEKAKKFLLIEQQFAEDGIAVRHGVDALLHRSQKLSDDLFPNAVFSFNTTISIPIYPALLKKEQQEIIESIWTLFEKGVI